MKLTKAKVMGNAPRLRRRTLRLSDYEESRLEDQAAIAGLTVAEFMRRLCTGSSPIIAHTDQRMIRELCRQGGLLKSNFRTLREAGASQELMEYMEELLRKIGHAIDRIGAGNNGR